MQQACSPVVLGKERVRGRQLWPQQALNNADEFEPVKRADIGLGTCGYGARPS